MKTELKRYTVEEICDGFEYNELEKKECTAYPGN